MDKAKYAAQKVTKVNNTAFHALPLQSCVGGVDDLGTQIGAGVLRGCLGGRVYLIRDRPAMITCGGPAFHHSEKADRLHKELAILPVSRIDQI